MTSPTLPGVPAWPERPYFAGTDDFDWCGYYQRLAAAYRARLLVAVEALRNAKEHTNAFGDHISRNYVCDEVDEALAAIGPLPGEG